MPSCHRKNFEEREKNERMIKTNQSATPYHSFPYFFQQTIRIRGISHPSSIFFSCLKQTMARSFLLTVVVMVVMMMAMGCVLGADLGSARDGSLKQCTSCEVFFMGVIKALGANATKEELKEEMDAERQREFGDKPADL